MGFSGGGGEVTGGSIYYVDFLIASEKQTTPTPPPTRYDYFTKAKKQWLITFQIISYCYCINCGRLLGCRRQTAVTADFLSHQLLLSVSAAGNPRTFTWLLVATSGSVWSRVKAQHCRAKAVSAHFTSEQILPFDFAGHGRTLYLSVDSNDFPRPRTCPWLCGEAIRGRQL